MGGFEEKYTPYKVKAKEGMGWEAAPRWLTQGHIFASPFYYIDYTLAQVLAFEFFNLDRKNHAKAWKKYLKLCKMGGKYPFVTLITKDGLKNPFAAGVLKKTIRPLAAPSPSHWRNTRRCAYWITRGFPKRKPPSGWASRGPL
jgi:oligoendopeptidase F